MTDAVDQLARECFEKHAVFPISFCLPAQKLRPFRARAKAKEMSFVIAGDKRTFVFRDEDSYMNEYQISKFARTRKKGGWDCVRHLEIMAASCLPVFENIEACPAYTMIHYPKARFQEIKDTFEKMSAAEYDRHVQAIYDWFSQHLTSDKMVDYMLRISHTRPVARVLFIDSALPQKPDCQSAMILSGLKNKFGNRCEVAYPLECLYASQPFPSKPKWWKTNFNIYRAFDDSVRSPNENSPDIGQIKKQIAVREYDLIIYGSITRSADLFKLVTANYSKSEVFCINGEDDYLQYSGEQLPPLTKRLKQRLRNYLRRNRLTGPQLDPSLSRLSQWRKLLADIQPHSTVFMREVFT